MDRVVWLFSFPSLVYKFHSNDSNRYFKFETIQQKYLIHSICLLHHQSFTTEYFGFSITRSCTAITVPDQVQTLAYLLF